ncbi:MAG: adenine deaminase [Bacteroidia bacterium]
MKDSQKFSGQIADVVNGRIFSGTVTVEQGLIASIYGHPVEESQFILPGLIDAHVHIESSMLVPAEFARLAVVHGTIGTVSDPHEIGNVLGVEGVEYMIESARQVPFYFNFGAPSCVPATGFETAGSTIGIKEVTELLNRNEIRYLSEMMNFPGVLSNDDEVMDKVKVAQMLQKPVDGHAPGLRGHDALRYIEAGISTDHECYTYEEALEKLKHGMKIIIREGSAAKNFEALIGLLDLYPDMIMFCSDDKHPDDLRDGHVNELVKRAMQKGIDFMKVLQAATLNPVRHYDLECGLLQPGDPADFILIDNPESFRVKATYIRGEMVASEGKTLLKRFAAKIPNNFTCDPVEIPQLQVAAKGKAIRVIEALNEQLVTGEVQYTIPPRAPWVECDTKSDVLKLVVYNRYKKADPAIAFVKGFGMKKGAIASSVAHDSHNIIAAGAKDSDIASAINRVVKERGGISWAEGADGGILSLPVAGLMSDGDGFEVAAKYEALDKEAKKLGSKLSSPYMTLSFMALLVIPALKLSDKGLFDGKKFEFTDLWVE